MLWLTVGLEFGISKGQSSMEGKLIYLQAQLRYVVDLPVSCSTCVEFISTVGLMMPVTSLDMLKV